MEGKRELLLSAGSACGVQTSGGPGLAVSSSVYDAQMGAAPWSWDGPSWRGGANSSGSTLLPLPTARTHLLAHCCVLLPKTLNSPNLLKCASLAPGVSGRTAARDSSPSESEFEAGNTAVDNTVVGVLSPSTLLPTRHPGRCWRAGDRVSLSPGKRGTPGPTAAQLGSVGGWPPCQ